MGFEKEQPGGYKEGDRFPGARELNDLKEGGTRHIAGATKIGSRYVIPPETPNVTFPDHRFFHERFRVLEVFDNYLKCEPLQLDASAGWWQPYAYTSRTTPLQTWGVVYVALPILLQREFWEGAAINLAGDVSVYEYRSLHKRVARGSTYVRLESVEESYFPGDVILAVRGVTGTADPDGRPIFWQDANAAGRKWGVGKKANFVLIEETLGTGTWQKKGRSLGREAFYDVEADTWSFPNPMALVEPLNSGQQFVEFQLYPAWYVGEATGGFDSTGTGTVGTGTGTAGGYTSVYVAEGDVLLEVLVDVECVGGNIVKTYEEVRVRGLV